MLINGIVWNNICNLVTTCTTHLNMINKIEMDAFN